ncbi:hypothetical protein ACHAWF_010913 [Thalassiosira exigua]
MTMTMTMKMKSIALLLVRPGEAALAAPPSSYPARRAGVGVRPRLQKSPAFAFSAAPALAGRIEARHCSIGPFVPTRLASLVLDGASVRATTALPSSSSSSLSSTSSGDVPDRTDGVDVSIEYCSGCRWALRATWIASELLTTFADDPGLASVTVSPRGPPLSEGGTFRISTSGGRVLWDRGAEGRFPEAKEVKRLVRDVVDPKKNLGHSDNKPGDDDGTAGAANAGDCAECKEEGKGAEGSDRSDKTAEQTGEQPDPSPTLPSVFYEKNRASIEYSTGPSVESPENGLYRATYYANELLAMTYERDALWKMQQRQMDGGESDDAGVEAELLPSTVESVVLIPNRVENDVLVRANIHTCHVRCHI